MNFLIVTEVYMEADGIKTHVSYKQEHVEADSPETAMLKRNQNFLDTTDPNKNDSSRIVDKESIVLGIFEVIGNEVGRYNHMDWILRLTAQNMWAHSHRDRDNSLKKKPLNK